MRTYTTILVATFITGSLAIVHAVADYQQKKVLLDQMVFMALSQ